MSACRFEYPRAYLGERSAPLWCRNPLARHIRGSMGSWFSHPTVWLSLAGLHRTPLELFPKGGPPAV
jgi:hypothetical protein